MGRLGWFGPRRITFCLRFSKSFLGFGSSQEQFLNDDIHGAGTLCLPGRGRMFLAKHPFSMGPSSVASKEASNTICFDIFNQYLERLLKGNFRLQKDRSTWRNLVNRFFNRLRKQRSRNENWFKPQARTGDRLNLYNEHSNLFRIVGTWCSPLLGSSNTCSWPPAPAPPSDRARPACVQPVAWLDVRLLLSVYCPPLSPCLLIWKLLFGIRRPNLRCFDPPKLGGRLF